MKRSDQVSAMNASTTDVSRVNRVRILQHLRDGATHTRIEIARALKMSPATVNRLSRRMTELGLIVKVGEVTEKRGRPADLIRFDADAFHVVAVSVHRDEFGFAEVNLDGTTSNLAVVPHRSRTGGDVASALRGALEDYLDHRQADSPLWAVGIAVPGNVDDRGVVSFQSDLGWGEASFTQELEERFGVPVSAENYCNLVALAEYHVGGYNRFSSLAAVCGCGGGAVGIILDGQLWRGAHGWAGTLGDPKVEGRGEDPTEKPGGACSLFTESASEHDSALEASAEAYAPLVTNVCRVLDPECLLLAGEAPWALNHRAEELRLRLEDSVPHPPVVVTATLGAQGALIGAGLGAMRHVGGIGSLF